MTPTGAVANTVFNWIVTPPLGITPSAVFNGTGVISSQQWINTTNAKNWLLCVGGLHADETLSNRTVYRPTWSFGFLQLNAPRDDFPIERPFLFDCLCGTRRQHRDYVMLALEKSNLLDQSIATYRDVFVGG